MQDLLTPQETRTGTDPAQLVNAFFDAINEGDTATAVDLLDPGCLHHGRISNYRPEGVRVLFNLLAGVFPDLRLDVREQHVEGRRVVSRIVATATHTGSFLGKPPTGQPLTWQSVDIAEVGDDGTILNRFWDVWGDPTLWRQIGFTPALMC